MKMLINRIKNLIFIVLKVIVNLFYDSKYLKGKYFESSKIGWIWAIKSIYSQKFLGKNRNVPFPVSRDVKISKAENLIVGTNNMNNFQAYGIYFQNFYAKIILGDNVYIAPNVGLITANHDPSDVNEHLGGKDIIIGDKSWIGMNSVILPGTILGPNTIVGAGSVVTKSFKEGNVVIAGNPAKILRKLSH